jgi:hypothetical protein
MASYYDLLLEGGLVRIGPIYVRIGFINGTPLIFNNLFVNFVNWLGPVKPPRINSNTGNHLEAVDFKYLLIQNKKELKFLCFSHDDVLKIQELLKEVAPGDLFFLNTNFGLEVFYYSSTDLNELILSTLKVVTAGDEKKFNPCHIEHYDNGDQIKTRIHENITLLNSMPLTYKLYVQSWFKQMQRYDETNSRIIHELIIIWRDAMSKSAIIESNRKTFITNMNQFIDENRDVADKLDLERHLAELVLQVRRRN